MKKIDSTKIIILLSKLLSSRKKEFRTEKEKNEE